MSGIEVQPKNSRFTAVLLFRRKLGLRVDRLNTAPLLSVNISIATEQGPKTGIRYCFATMTGQYPNQVIYTTAAVYPLISIIRRIMGGMH